MVGFADTDYTYESVLPTLRRVNRPKPFGGPDGGKANGASTGPFSRTDVHVSQLGIEEWEAANPDFRVSQLGIEVWRTVSNQLLGYEQTSSVPTRAPTRRGRAASILGGPQGHIVVSQASLPGLPLTSALGWEQIQSIPTQAHPKANPSLVAAILGGPQGGAIAPAPPPGPTLSGELGWEPNCPQPPIFRILFFGGIFPQHGLGLIAQAALPGPPLGNEFGWEVLLAPASRSRPKVNSSSSPVGGILGGPGGSGGTSPTILTVTDMRVSQLGVEEWLQANPAMRVSQLGIEEWRSVPLAVPVALAGNLTAASTLKGGLALPVAIAGNLTAISMLQGPLNTLVPVSLAGQLTAMAQLRTQIALPLSLSGHLTSAAELNALLSIIVPQALAGNVAAMAKLRALLLSPTATARLKAYLQINV